MKIAIAGDHAGFQLKAFLTKELRKAGHEVEDLGAHEYVVTDDYPDFAVLVADALRAAKVDRGILICGSGVGVCIAVNKYPGLRAGVCHDTYTAAQGVEHDDMNVLCLGERVVGPALASQIVRAFATAKYSGGSAPRHRRRLDKVLAIEKRFLRDPAVNDD